MVKIVPHKDVTLRGAEYVPESTEFEIRANLYEKVPNGGVVVLRITGEDKVEMEKLLFLEPASKPLPFTVTTDEEDYEPGDQVKISIDLPYKHDTISTEKFFASVTVTDMSSFLQVAKHK